MIGYILVVVVLAVIFRKRIQQWLESLEGPIARMRNRNDGQDMQEQQHYNYAQMDMPAQNINYADPNSAYRYQPSQNLPIYPPIPPNYPQAYNQPSPPAYYTPPQSNPYETRPSLNQSNLNDNDIQRRINGSGVNPYVK